MQKKILKIMLIVWALAKALRYRSVQAESVLAADTVVVCAGKMFGKSKDIDEAC
ncbi:MAG: hypothetical protein R3E08_03830 [Thiotrichaceae bacterium]